MAPEAMDYIKAPLNACSIESLALPIDLPDNGQVWPVMLGCYQLDGNGNRRIGSLDLYTVRVPDIANHRRQSMRLEFGSPIPVISASSSSGILDGKWRRGLGSQSSYKRWWMYATAHSSGCIQVHSCSPTTTTETTSIDDHPSAITSLQQQQQQQPCFETALVGTSEPLSYESHPPLCLSLSWDNHHDHPNSASTTSSSCQMVSTYSDGRVAVHDVSYSEHSGKVQLLERDSWLAHTIFTSKAEVWTASFVGQTNHNSGDDSSSGSSSESVVVSGGDDGILKIWDLRSTNRPVQVLKDHFDAGVTVVSPHPRHPHLFACGSYDETICLYDMRYLSSGRGRPLAKSAPLGGGIWRLKWHPLEDNRLLVAAMHGGCRIVQIDDLLQGGSSSPPCIIATKEFTQHTSMAYGADWLVCKHPKREGYFEAAASCSFYDQAVYLWDTVA